MSSNPLPALQDDKDKLAIRVIRNGYLVSTNMGKWAFTEIPPMLEAIRGILESGRDEFKIVQPASRPHKPA